MARNEGSDVLKAIYGMADAEKIALQLVEELRKKDSNLDELMIKYTPALWMGQSLGSVAVRYSTFRSTIKESTAKKRNEMLDKLRINRDLTALLKEEQENKAIENKKNKEIFDLDSYFAKIEEMAKIIDEIDLRKTNDIYIEGSNLHTNRSRQRETAYYCASFIGMTTGKRFTEVIKTMEISRKGRNISISGILKKKSNELETLQHCVLLAHFETVEKALKILRINFDTTKFTVSIVSKKFGLVFRNYLQNNILETDKYTFHDLRKMYAQACWEKFGKHTDIDQKEYFGSVLGHTKKVDATDHYMVLKTKDNK
jgi:hypothetical protein